MIKAYLFLSMGLDALHKTVDIDDFRVLKREVLGKLQYLKKHIPYPYEEFSSIDEYQKPVDNLKKENFFSELKNGCPSNETLEIKKENLEKFNIEIGEKLTQLYSKNDVFSTTDIFEKFVKTSFKEFDIILLYCVSLPGYTWQSGLKYTDINLQTLQDKELISLLENKIKGGKNSVMCHSYLKSD